MNLAELDWRLLLATFAWTCLLAAMASLLVGLAYLASRPLLGADAGPAFQAARARRRLVLELSETRLATIACRRAVGAGAAVIGLLIATPWLGARLNDFEARWRQAMDGDGRWTAALLALAVWIGLMPLAAFLWALPGLSLARRSMQTPAWAARLGTDPSPGLPHELDAGDLAEDRPYCRSLRRACDAYALSAGLWAGAHRRGDSPLAAMVAVPIAAAAVAAGWLHLWIGLVAAAAIVVWSIVARVHARRAARSAPGTAALDYLMLVAASRDGRSRETGRRAESYLDVSPATLQDHAQLIARLADARTISEPVWDPTLPSVPDVVPATLTLADRVGQESTLHVAIRLRFGEERRWLVTRIWFERVVPVAATREAVHMPLPVAWT